MLYLHWVVRFGIDDGRELFDLCRVYIVFSIVSAQAVVNVLKQELTIKHSMRH